MLTNRDNMLQRRMTSPTGVSTLGDRLGNGESWAQVSGGRETPLLWREHATSGKEVTGSGRAQKLARYLFGAC